MVGVDLKKDRQILTAAYNDAAGITAAFNLNLLNRIDRELDASLDVEGFHHKAHYNEEMGRVEMHLISCDDQQIQVGNSEFDLAANETIHTENSHKYDIDEFQRLASQSGFNPVKVWTDANRWFSVHYLER